LKVVHAVFLNSVPPMSSASADTIGGIARTAANRAQESVSLAEARSLVDQHTALHAADQELQRLLLNPMHSGIFKDWDVYSCQQLSRNARCFAVLE